MMTHFIVGIIVGSGMVGIIGMIWISESFSLKNMLFKFTFREGDLVYDKSYEFSKDNWYKLTKIGSNMVQLERISSNNSTGLVGSRTVRKHELVGDYAYCPLNRKELKTKAKFNKQLKSVLND